MNKLVYMDNNATTPLHPEVKKLMTRAMELFGNASSLHQFGREARGYVEGARQSVASVIGAGPEEIIFVGSGSEANNTVLNIAACSCGACKLDGCCKPGIITTDIEHPCVLETAKCLGMRGTEVRFLGVDEGGVVNPGQLDEMLKESPAGLVSIMMANNEIGTIQDISSLAEIAHRHGALFHTDAVQAVGKIPVIVGDLGIDFLTISAHKIYGPKGVGALYVKKGVPFCSMIRGGHQERGRRAGTENTLGIIGLGSAADMLRMEWKEDSRRLAALKEQLWSGISERIQHIRLNSPSGNTLPGTLNISFEGIEGEAILLSLDLEGIAVSTGSACSSGSLEPSYVLLAIGLSPEEAHGSIRFSLGRENTREDIEYVMAKLPPSIERLRRMSSVYQGGAE